MGNPLIQVKILYCFFTLRHWKSIHLGADPAMRANKDGSITGDEDQYSGLSGAEKPPSDVIPETQGVQ